MMKNPPHPGIGIKDEIDALKRTVAEAAKSLGVTRQQLYRLINGESGVTPEMAYRLEQSIGSNADFWLRLQNNFDMAQVRRRASSIKATKLTPNPV